MEDITFPTDMNTTSLQNMSAMFYQCYALTDLNLNSMKVSSVTNMMQMFYECVALKTVDVSEWQWRTNNTVRMDYNVLQRHGPGYHLTWVRLGERKRPAD